MLDSVSFTDSVSQWMPTIGAILSIIFSVPSLALVETCGRRKLFLYTLLVCAISNYMLLIFSLLAEIQGVLFYK